MILVTGAAGKTGRAVIQALSARGEAVRALVRRPEQIEETKAIGAVEVEIADLRERESLTSAFAGMRAIYHIGPNAHPVEEAIGKSAIAAARAAEIPHFVLHSVLYPQIQAMPHHWAKLRIEEHLINSDLGFTILQPASYMQNIRGVWASILKGHYPVPYPVDVRFSPIDLKDVAELAAEVLSSPGHEGSTYELAGPEFLTAAQMAQRMSEVLGINVEAEEIPRARWLQETQLDSERADILLSMFEYYAEHGFWGNPRVLAGLLGREPTTFLQYLRRQVREEAKGGG